MSDTTPQTPWIWLADPRDGARARVERVRFRHVLPLTGAPEHASLRLSARSHYHLRVNGCMVGMGPARSYPEYREEDSYDLRAFLRAGTNTLDVEVLHWDLSTFHGLREPPGFAAWGSVCAADGKVHGLETPGTWRCQRVEGVAADAPRLSFAQGPVEIIDLRAAGATPAWHVPGTADPGAVDVLQPRAIPPLTQTPVPAAIVAVSPVTGDEVIVGARMVFDGAGNADPTTPQSRHAVLATWVHSATAQTVAAGVWWGEYWLNGALLLARPDPRVPLRSATELALRAGWNRLVGLQRLAFGYAEFCLALPRAAHLRLDPARATHGPDGLWLAGPLLDADVTRHTEALTGNAEELPDLGWSHVPTGDTPTSPLRHIAWARPVGPLEATALPLTVPAGRGALITVDMGKLVLGRFAFDIDAPHGTVLDVAHAEERCGGRAHIGKACTVYGADRWILPGARQRVESFSPRGFRYLDILISGSNEPVTLHAAGALEQRYPFAFTGEFACSDDDFNRLWAYGRRTLELCSEDVFTDCPWRERTLYGGDLLPEMATTVALTRDLRLVRRSLDVLLQSFNPENGWLQSRAPSPRDGVSLCDYPLLTAIAVAWYLRLTGDTEFARRAWPVFEAMDVAVGGWRRPDGLYAPPVPAFIDHGRRLGAGPTCAFNAALVAAFRAWAAVGRAVGKTTEADALERRGRDLDTRVAVAFFDPAAGTFRDLPLSEGGHETEGSPANSWPLLFCRSVRSNAPTVLTALARTLDAFRPDRESESVSPYQMFYLLSALRDQGAAELAETTIRRIYAQMLANPTGTLWEQSHPDKSLVHAWSSGVNDYLTTAVLGVRLGFCDPGELTRVRIAPCAASVTWARGRVPHPLGDVDVAWERHADGLHVSVTAPEGVPVDVSPAGPLAGLPCFVSRKQSVNASAR